MRPLYYVSPESSFDSRRNEKARLIEFFFQQKEKNEKKSFQCHVFKTKKTKIRENKNLRNYENNITKNK